MEDSAGKLTVDGTLDRRLWASALLNGTIVVAEAFGGILSGSLALLSDAAHNLGDVAAVGLALWARVHGRRPSTLRYTYGFKRAEVFTAMLNAVTLIAVTALIAREAFVRLSHPRPVAQAVMIGVGLVALGANLASVFLLHRHDKEDVNVRSAFLHMAQDAVASLVVVVAGLLAHTAAGPYIDAAAALLVGIAVLRSALSLAWETIATLMDAVPNGLDLEALARDIARRFPRIELHHVHAWQNGPGQRLLTAHVALPASLNAEAIEGLFSKIKTQLHERWDVAHATLEPEVAGCGDDGLLGRWPAGMAALHQTDVQLQ